MPAAWSDIPGSSLVGRMHNKVLAPHMQSTHEGAGSMLCDDAPGLAPFFRLATYASRYSRALRSLLLYMSTLWAGRPSRPARPDSWDNRDKALMLRPLQSNWCNSLYTLLGCSAVLPNVPWLLGPKSKGAYAQATAQQLISVSTDAAGCQLGAPEPLRQQGHGADTQATAG